MNISYAHMFHALHPGFFARESIHALPPEDIFEELVLDLRADVPSAELPHPEGIVFGLYTGDREALRCAVRAVDADWAKYFTDDARVYCAFERGQVVSFCILDDFGTYECLRIGGPGCVGTLPSHRRRGVGLKMVQKATDILREDGFDLSMIHFTHLGRWYARLGYTPVLRWSAEGIIGES